MLKMYGAPIDTGSIDLAALVQSLAAKLDASVFEAWTTTWKSGDSWYVKFGNGYIMQGGFLSNPGTSNTINLFTPFTGSSYSVLLTVSYTAGGNTTPAVNPTTKTASSFQMQISGTAGFTGYHWMACGS